MPAVSFLAGGVRPGASIPFGYGIPCYKWVKTFSYSLDVYCVRFFVGLNPTKPGHTPDFGSISTAR